MPNPNKDTHSRNRRSSSTICSLVSRLRRTVSILFGDPKPHQNAKTRLPLILQNPHVYAIVMCRRPSSQSFIVVVVHRRRCRSSSLSFIVVVVHRRRRPSFVVVHRRRRHFRRRRRFIVHRSSSPSFIFVVVVRRSSSFIVHRSSSFIVVVVVFFFFFFLLQAGKHLTVSTRPTWHTHGRHFQYKVAQSPTTYCKSHLRVVSRPTT